MKKFSFTQIILTSLLIAVPSIVIWLLSKGPVPFDHQTDQNTAYLFSAQVKGTTNSIEMELVGVAMEFELHPLVGDRVTGFGNTFLSDIGAGKTDMTAMIGTLVGSSVSGEQQQEVILSFFGSHYTHCRKDIDGNYHYFIRARKLKVHKDNTENHIWIAVRI